MSLVNDMLKDLDKRSRGSVQPGSAGMAIDYSGNENSLSYLKIGLAVIVGILVGIASIYFLFSDPVPEIDPSLQAAQQIQNNSVIAESEVEEQIELPNSIIRARIAGGRETDTGFEVRIEVTEQVSYEILSRTDRQFQFLVREVAEIGNTAPIFNGMSVIQSSDGMLLSLNPGRSTEFLVYENAVGQLFTLTIEGFWSEPDSGVRNTQTSPGEDMQNVSESQPFLSGETSPDTDIVENNQQTLEPVRTTRELSLQDRDRNLSQQALRLAQDGELIEAYNVLYNFIGNNPEAHQSRNTLATLLFAQQEFLQVKVLVDEGLLLAPNHAGYKKIKARLYIREGDLDAAIRLLNSSPPAMADDTEYFELLSSLYQQNGEHRQAIEIYQELIRVDRMTGRWWTGLAISHEAMGNYGEALNSYQVAIQNENLDSRLRQYSQGRIRELSNP